ncbi:MAG: TetR family transcriptional regulator [Acidimicrobiales bacterium]
MSETTDDLLATDGRVIGQRAQLTRRRILDATAALLREHGALEVKVIDVARVIDASPATFYQYFSDVEDAILALATDLVRSVSSIQEQFDRDWSGGLEHARTLVTDYLDFWDEHGPVLRVMLLRADEKDERFRQVRREYNAPFMAKMVSKVRAAQSAGRLAPEIDPEAAAGAMLAVMDRLPNYRQGFEKRGTTREAMIETVARLLYSSLTGAPLSG